MAEPTPEPTPEPAARPRGPLHAFRDWRRTRPFWGGALLAAAGVELMAAPAAVDLILPLNLVIYAGVAGISLYLIGLLLIALGVLVWLQPQQRAFYAVVGTLLSVASFVVANFGGFVIGMLLGIVGGALVFSWRPERPQQRSRGGADPDPDGSDEAAESGGAEDGGPAAQARSDAIVRRAERPPEDGGSGAGADSSGPAGGDAAGGVSGSGPDAGGAHRKLHGWVAAPLALALALPAAAPADIQWPWDDWFGGGDDEESAPADPESPSPSPSQSPSPSEPGEGTPPEEEPGDGGGGGEDGEESEEAEEPEGDGDPADCEVRTGAESSAETEEEFLAAVEACEAAREAGAAPEAPLADDAGPFTASDAESGLTADSMTMYGAQFGGVVEYPASSGPERYLQIRMDEGAVTGGELWWMHNGSRASLGLPEMDLAGADGGQLVLHVQELTITILGISITFTPDFPPPLLPSLIPIPNVEVTRPVADAGHLAVDGLDLRASS